MSVRPAADRAAELLACARARFAATRADAELPRTLGEIVLRPDQLDALRRVRARIRRDGGCLLADDVGSGKTYVALAAAREWARPLLVVPASLRATWSIALRRATISCPMVSHESLSRGAAPAGTFDGIVVDESHRFRGTSRRHAALARLAARAPVLMLSATPLQNHPRELAAQLALFLGESAYRLEPAALAAFVVRSAAALAADLPRVAPPRWLELSADDGEVLRALLALPPPPRALDAGDGGALLLVSLVRAWASSRAALAATLRRRRRTVIAIEQCHAEGRLPTRAELASWHGEADVQLGFASLLASAVAGEDDVRRVAGAITAERDALDEVFAVLAGTEDPDPPRVAALRQLRAAHRGASVLAFSEYAASVRAYHSAMRGDVEVGMLTAREARIASGRVSRDALLARFAPRAHGLPPPPARERVSLLLATDLLSEGVNLQDASVVVHLDLPWNPARLAQRLGRVRRPGGAPEVASYLMAPPARAALLLRAEQRLRAKLARAERTIGRSLDVLPRLSAASSADPTTGSRSAHADDGRPLAAAELLGEIDRLLRAWRPAPAARGTGETDHADAGGACVVAAVDAPVRGWVAALDDGRFLAALAHDAHAGVASEAPAAIARALALAAGPSRAPCDNERIVAVRALGEWLAIDRAARACALDAAASPARRRLLQLVGESMRAAPRHRLAEAATVAGRLRAALTRPLPLGLERELVALSEQRSADWLERAAALLASAPTRIADGAPVEPRVTAIILLGGAPRD
ncbi:MAG TPA: helicase-related protein [Gemmatimonadaceae bacterium]|nr:helicase-related protein [Gemmatimonadaceae bacterium]